MRNQFLASCVVVLVCASCQSTSYTQDSISSPPSKDGLSDAVYAARLIVHKFPQNCMSVPHEDDPRPGDFKRKIKTPFTLSMIDRNEAHNEWFRSYILSGNTRGFVYANIKTDVVGCGERGWDQFALKGGLRNIWKSTGVDSAKLGRAKPVLTAITPTSKAISGKETRPIAFMWEGINNLIAGNVEINQRTGIVSLTLPDDLSKCNGTYKMDSRTTGIWVLQCSNGLSANGTLKALGAGKGSTGTGTDSKGRKVSYTMGQGEQDP